MNPAVWIVACLCVALTCIASGWYQYCQGKGDDCGKGVGPVTVCMCCLMSSAVAYGLYSSRRGAY